MIAHWRLTARARRRRHNPPLACFDLTPFKRRSPWKALSKKGTSAFRFRDFRFHREIPSSTCTEQPVQSNLRRASWAVCAERAHRATCAGQLALSPPPPPPRRAFDGSSQAACAETSARATSAEQLARSGHAGSCSEPPMCL